MFLCIKRHHDVELLSGTVRAAEAALAGSLCQYNTRARPACHISFRQPADAHQTITSKLLQTCMAVYPADL